MSVRWGIVGCGDVVRRRVAQAIFDEPNSEIVGACRRNSKSLAEFCHRFGVPKSFEQDKDLFHDSEIDAVYIATPVNIHLPQTIAAAEQGKHVLVEKPMAMSTVECNEMIAVCRANHVKLGVAYYRRFYPVVARIKEVLASGEIGELLSINFTTAAAFAIDPHEDGYWRVIPEQGGGGALMDIGSHRIDLMLHMFGPIEQVRCLCGTVAANYSAENCVSAVMRFRNGVHGNLQCFFGSSIDPDEFTLTGTKGRIVSAPLNGGDLKIQTASTSREESHPPCNNFNLPLIADFVRAIKEDRDPMITGDNGRDVNQVIEQAYANANK